LQLRGTLHLLLALGNGGVDGALRQQRALGEFYAETMNFCCQRRPHGVGFCLRARLRGDGLAIAR